MTMLYIRPEDKLLMVKAYAIISDISLFIKV